MLGSLQAKLIGGGIAFLALMGAFLWLKGVLHDRSELRDWQHTVLVTTQAASNNPKLIARDVPKQIENLGGALQTLKGSLAVQNKAVDDLDQKRKDALAEADRQAALRKEVIEQSQELTKQLRSSALKPVEKAQLEDELRRVQDMAWEAGL